MVRRCWLVLNRLFPRPLRGTLRAWLCAAARDTACLLLTLTSEKGPGGGPRVSEYYPLLVWASLNPLVSRDRA